MSSKNSSVTYRNRISRSHSPLAFRVLWRAPQNPNLRFTEDTKKEDCGYRSPPLYLRDTPQIKPSMLQTHQNTSLDMLSDTLFHWANFKDRVVEETRQNSAQNRR